jgi:hypothetical protein
MQIDVNLSIEDLYPALMVSRYYEELAVNTGLMDFLDNMAGLELNRLDIKESISYFLRNKLNMFGNTADRIKGRLTNYRANESQKFVTFFKRFFGG